MASSTSPSDARPDVAAATAPAVVFEHVSFAFDDHQVLSDVSFSVPRGSMCIIFGASGVGKSIVLKLILGLLRPDSGAIYVNGAVRLAHRERERRLPPVRGNGRPAR